MSVAFGTIPGTLGAQAASSGELEWPNPGAVKLTKEANPVEGKLDEWDITLTVEGKNLKSGSSDVVLVIDKSGSMTQKPNQNRLPKAKDAAKKFVDNLLIEDSDTRIAVVTFNKTSDQVSDFKGLDQKTELKRAIDNIQATGGTNIQAGLHEAQELLKTSQANNKVIVLLSDGEPTYSYKASTAVKGSWGNNSHQFILSDFNDKNIIGSGSSYSLGSNWYGLGKETCFLWSCSYEFEIKDNGIGTISEAKLAHDAGIHIYSIGLDVGSNSNATNTLKDVANKGYYSGTSDSLERIFSELASKIAFAAENAVVTDPMGDMFDLKLKGSSFGPDDYKASQGEVTWNPQTETFTWNIGNVTEGNPATLTYRVKMDHSKNPDPKQLYPTNKTTTMNYTDAKGDRTSKDFEVPRVGLGKGSILVKAYKVNANGKPVNSDGQEVERPDLAQELYSRYHEEDGSDALEVGKSYTVPAPTVPGYTLRVGDNPTKVDLTVSKPSPIIWFGYNDVPNKLTIVHQSGDKVLDRSEADKKPGESIDVSSKNFDGYEFSNVEVSKGSGLTVDSGHVTGVMPGQDVTITFHYTANDQSVKVRYVDRATGKDLLEPSVKTGKTGETLTLEAAHVAGYEAEKPTTVEYVLKAGENPDHIFYYNGTEQSLKVRYVDRGTGKELLVPIVKTGKTGEELTLKAEEIAGYEAEEPTTVEYVLKAENPDHVFYYNGLGQGVKVRYVDRATGKDLLEPSVKTGKTGEELTLKAEEIAGYEAEEPKTVTYELKAGENPDHIFYYTAEKQTVTVKYLEKGTDKVLAEATAHEGATGQTVTLEAKPIPGYTAENDTYEYTFKAGKNEYTFYYTAKEQTVTVKYLLEGTKDVEVAAPDTFTGPTGSEKLLTAKPVEGYEPVDPSEYKYKFTAEANQEYIFYYKALKQTVTVKYLEKGTDKALAEATTHEGVTGETVTLEAKPIAGYTAENDTYAYTFKAGTNEYIFYYAGSSQTLTVKYLEQGTEKELAAEKLLEGVTGQTIGLTAKEVAGYKPLNATHKYTFSAEADQVYTFYYTKDDPTGEERTVIVHYVDRATEQSLKESTSHIGQVGSALTLKAEDITVTDSVYKPERYSVEYTVTADTEQEYTFYYNKVNEGETYTVTVHYVDQESNLALQAPSTHSGKAGEVLWLRADQITVTDAVYTPLKFNELYTITTASDQQYTFYYVKGEHGDIQLLTVNHLEAETNHVLKESERVKGRAGEQVLYRTSPITVTGAVYHPEHPSYSYTFTAEPEQMLNIFYKKNPSQTEHKVTVKYLEQGTGNTLAAPTTKSGKPGEQVTLTAVPVSGYTPVKSSDTYTFTDAEGQEYIFYYTKNSSNPDPDGGSPGGSTTTITPSPKPLPPVPPVPPLPPVPPKLDMENHYNYINGYPDGTVKPENQISREEVAAIFYRLMENESRANYLTDQNSFSDVAKKRWSNKHISTMERAGIITGYQDGTFKPGQSITRAEFAAIASRFDKLNDQANGMFSDISGHWAEKYIVSAANKGWIKGYPDGTFKPNQYITRAEAMAFINSVLNRKVKAADIHDDAKQWPDNKPGKWYYTDVLEATNHHEYSRSENGYETWDSIQPDRVYP
ncbi:MucBP domain-containing protein [Paenibacillus dendritiformis]|uniref:MucBP domain-containing protein n=1 Tax=Paenibacillus dendritiformis TaxID=130049 RepID=UPI001BCBF59C|nr:MucBP domain-containing protein [Paenibacillus dendritiformis]